MADELGTGPACSRGLGAQAQVGEHKTKDVICVLRFISKLPSRIQCWKRKRCVVTIILRDTLPAHDVFFSSLPGPPLAGLCEPEAPIRLDAVHAGQRLRSDWACFWRIIASSTWMLAII